MMNHRINKISYLKAAKKNGVQKEKADGMSEGGKYSYKKMQE